jgi:lipoprotein-releasing system permease protein
MALRLLRTRWINLVSILGVTLGVASIIVVLAVMDGFQRDLRAMIRGTLSDVLVEINPESVPYAKLKGELEGIPGVEAVTLQRHTFGAVPASRREALGSRSNYIPVKVSGMLPEDEDRVSRVLSYMQPMPDSIEDYRALDITPPKDARPTPPDPFLLDSEKYQSVDPEVFIPDEWPRVVISEWLARRLGTAFGSRRPGDTFDLITFEEEVDENGERRYLPATRKVVISRIYKSGNSEFDRGNLYVDLRNTGRVFFAAPEGTVCELRVRLGEGLTVDEMRPPLARAIGEYDPEVLHWPEGRIESWQDRNRNFLRAVESEKFMLAFVLFFIVVVACFGIFATLTMMVVEKTRDIGVLRALGATPGGILAIFMLNGTLIGIFGSLLGYVSGVYVAHRVNPLRDWIKETFGWDIFPPDIYLFDEIPTYIDHAAAIQYAIGAAVAALLFAIIPAVRAALLRPVRALRYE